MIISDAGCAHPDDAAVPTAAKKYSGGYFVTFSVGRFLRAFFEDAKEASGLLNVALTKRNSVPMCGVPYHAAPSYISKLIKAGRRVAICDQTSEPQPGKIVSRDITRSLALEPSAS